jgi:hypothetical protein
MIEYVLENQNIYIESFGLHPDKKTLSVGGSLTKGGFPRSALGMDLALD